MISLPVFSSLVSLLSQSVSEPIKKLFKPASMVAAAIFVVINLLLVLPPLRDYGFAAIIAIETLPTAWQILLGTIVLFALAYVIGSLGGVFLNFLNGDAFRESDLGGFFRD
jgi:hypothetical protein